jgi:hypothetical protein
MTNARGVKTVLLAIIGATVLPLTAVADSITAEPYATAYSEHLAGIFPPSILSMGHLSGPDTAFYFSGVEAIVHSLTSVTTYEGCAPSTPVGNGIQGGCPTKRPPGIIYTESASHIASSTSHTTSVSDAGDAESYSGTTVAGTAGLNESGSFSASVTSPSAGLFGYLNDYATGDENLIVAPTASDPAGTTGSMILTYTISPPSVTGSVTGGNAYWYGEWAFESWLSAAPASTNAYQTGTVDLSTLTGAKEIQFTVPFVFGSASNVKVGYDVGIGWVAAGGGPLNATGSFDPMESLTRIEVLGPNSVPLTSFSITDSEGNAFGPSGFVTPEPSTWVLTAIGLLMMLLVRRRKRI